MASAVFAAALLAVSSLVASCGGGANPAADALPGAALFQEKNCVVCHGAGGEGRATGPELRNVGKHFTREQLVEYLKNPTVYAEKDPRLAARMHDFPGMMPKYDYLEPTQLEQLADYVLALTD
jgi:mono/diheme cytochrome c family protein